MLLSIEVHCRFNEISTGGRKTVDIHVENRDDPFFVFNYVIDSNEFDK